MFEQIEKTVDVLLTKYIKAIISYDGIHRIETYEYPEEAVREALLNAIAHKDDSSGAAIQISVYKDRMMIWYAGQLLDKHSSRPYNPDIANAFLEVATLNHGDVRSRSAHILCLFDIYGGMRHFTP